MSDSDVQPLVTQCPSCHTQFRVGESQLQVAGGKVRCGACLTVFQGVDNLVWDGAEAPPADELASGNPTDLDGLLDDIDAVEPAADTADTDTENENENENEDAASAAAPETAAVDEETPVVGEAETASVLGVSGTEAAISEAPAADASEYAPEYTPEGESEDEPEDEPEDETEAETVAAAGDEVEAPPRRTLEITLDELEAQLLSGEPLELPEPEETEETEETREPGAQGELGEPRAESGAAPAEALIPAEDLEAVKRVAREEAARDAEPAAADPAPVPAGPVDAERTPSAMADAEDGAAVAPAADDPFARLRSDTPPETVDPFERLAAKQREMEPALPTPGRSIWPPVGIAVGVLLLIGQVLFLRFNAWTQNPQIRPVYEALCSALPCTVPPLKALEFMAVVKKSARSHPSVDNALQIDMVIANRAPFAQTFPLLEIVFTDFNNDVVAGRRFKPSEYLAGELKGQTEIPAQTPVRVQLEIEDLGDDAINYNITFR